MVGKFHEMKSALPEFLRLMGIQINRFHSQNPSLENRLERLIRAFEVRGKAQDYRDRISRLNGGAFPLIDERYEVTSDEQGKLEANYGFANIDVKGANGYSLVKTVNAFSRNFSGENDGEQKKLPIMLPEEHEGDEEMWIKPVEPSAACFKASHYNCTENRILNWFALESGVETDLTGNIFIFTETIPCTQCIGVFSQFVKKFPNIKLTISFFYPKVKPTKTKVVTMLNLGIDVSRISKEKLK